MNNTIPALHQAKMEELLTGNPLVSAEVGDAENNELTGGGTVDSLFGNGGADVLKGGAGNDLLVGGSETEREDYREDGENGQEWTVWVYGETFIDDEGDRLYGQEGDDILVGGPGSDYLEGGAGNDYLIGDALVFPRQTAVPNVFSYNPSHVEGEGADILLGGAGNDYLNGGGGFDIMNGGAGDDTLVGNGNYEVMIGGPGADVFDFESMGYGEAKIMDFEVGIDKIRLEASSQYGFFNPLINLHQLAELADLEWNWEWFASEDEGGVVIQLDNQVTVNLAGVNMEELNDLDLVSYPGYDGSFFIA